MKDKYIIKLAKTNKTIIIPDLGAIVVTQNENNPFVFNEFLKFNDGVLQSYISKKEEISKEEAKVEIEKFVNSVLSQLEENAKFDFGKVGVFIKKDSKLSLVKELVQNDDNLNQINQIEKEEKEVIAQPVLEKNNVTDVDKKDLKKESDVVINKENEYINKKTNMTETKENPQKKKKPMIPIMIVIVVLVILILGYFGFNNTSPKNDVVNTEIITQEVKDTIAIVEEVIEEEVDLPLSIEDVRLVTGKYYIIAGVFSDYDNADALLKHMNDFYEISTAEYSGVKEGNFVVSFEVFDDKSEALEKLLEYRQIEPKAWLHHAR